MCIYSYLLLLPPSDNPIAVNNNNNDNNNNNVNIYFTVLILRNLPIHGLLIKNIPTSHPQFTRLLPYIAPKFTHSQKFSLFACCTRAI